MPPSHLLCLSFFIFQYILFLSIQKMRDNENKIDLGGHLRFGIYEN